MIYSSACPPIIESEVFISQDEGKSWRLADGVPKGDAAIVIKHLFDNRYVSAVYTFWLCVLTRGSQAFILTRGTTHYRTEDHGKSWRPFNMPVRPALVSRPLSFHSNKKNYGYILYQGMTCDHIGWSSVCRDEASA
jgi:hypothetical protein